jgi:hypothetical protein
MSDWLKQLRRPMAAAFGAWYIIPTLSITRDDPSGRL